MSTISSTRSSTQIPSARPYRIQGVGVVLAGLVLTGSGAAVVHHFGRPDGTWTGEFTTELVAGVLGYLVAYGPAWWRPRRSVSAGRSATRTALLLALVSAVLVPICYWNPMPLTFAASALMLLSWGRAATTPSGADRRLVPVVTVLSFAVIAVQVVAFLVHVIQSS